MTDRLAAWAALALVALAAIPLHIANEYDTWERNQPISVRSNGRVFPLGARRG